MITLDAANAARPSDAPSATTERIHPQITASVSHCAATARRDAPQIRSCARLPDQPSRDRRPTQRRRERGSLPPTPFAPCPPRPTDAMRVLAMMPTALKGDRLPALAHWRPSCGEECRDRGCAGSRKGERRDQRDGGTAPGLERRERARDDEEHERQGGARLARAGSAARPAAPQCRWFRPARTAVSLPRM